MIPRFSVLIEHQGHVFAIDGFTDAEFRHRRHLEPSSAFDRDIFVFPAEVDDQDWLPTFEAKFVRTKSGKDHWVLSVFQPSKDDEEWWREEGIEGLYWHPLPSGTPILQMKAPKGTPGKEAVPGENTPLNPWMVAHVFQGTMNVRFSLDDNPLLVDLRSEAQAVAQGLAPADLTDAQFRQVCVAGRQGLLQLASDPQANPDHLATLAFCGWLPLLRKLARNPQTPLDTLLWLGGVGLYPQIVAKNGALDVAVLIDPAIIHRMETPLAAAFVDTDQDDD